MFGQAKNAAKLMAQQNKIKKILATVRVVGTSKNGKVRVIMNGSQEVIAVEVDQEVIKVEFQTINDANHFFSKSENSLTKCLDKYIKKETALY